MTRNPDHPTRPPSVQDPALQSIVSALQGCEVEGDESRWTASVDGVHADDRGWWFQVSRADDASASVVVRCSRFATADHLRALLCHWRPATSYTLQVLEGMSPVHP
jgi:hypothetical protein